MGTDLKEMGTDLGKRMEEVLERYGKQYDVYCKKGIRLNVNQLNDDELILRGDGVSFYFILKPKKISM